MAPIADANLHEFVDDWLASELPVTDKLTSRQEDGVTVGEEDQIEEISYFFGTGCHDDSITQIESYNRNIQQQQEQHLQQQQQQKLVVDHEKNGSSQFSISSCNSPVVAAPPPPLPIGLNLTITQSFMDKLPLVGQSGANASANGKGSCSGLISTDDSIADHDEPPICSSQEKKKRAVNFPISTIQIGRWKKDSRHEGDVVAKCYYQKQKLVWEALDGNLKAKIEFPWSDIIAIRATLFPNKPGVLELMLNQIPRFFREINPMPRRHTNWQASSDFTNGQATLVRKHILKFAPGVLDKHYESLIRSDESLHTLSSQPFPDQASPYFYVPVIHFSPPSPPLHHITSLNHYTYPNYPQHPNDYSTVRLMDGTVDRNIYGNGYGVVLDRSRMRVYPAAVEGCQISDGHQVDMLGNNHDGQRQQWLISNHKLQHHHRHHQDLSNFQQGVLRGGEGGVPVTKQQLIDDHNRVCSDYYPTELPTPNAAAWLNQMIRPSPSSITMGINIANQSLKQLEQIQQGFNGNYDHDNNCNHMAPVADHNNTMPSAAVDNGMSTLDLMLQQLPTFVNYTPPEASQNFEPSPTAWMMGSAQQAGSRSVMTHMSPPAVFEHSLGLYEYCA